MNTPHIKTLNIHSITTIFLLATEEIMIFFSAVRLTFRPGGNCEIRTTTTYHTPPNNRIKKGKKHNILKWLRKMSMRFSRCEMRHTEEKKRHTQSADKCTETTKNDTALELLFGHVNIRMLTIPFSTGPSMQNVEKKS